MGFHRSLFRLNNSAFSFISGIFISEVVQILTSLRFEEPSAWSLTIIVSMVLMGISSIFWISLAVQLQPLQDAYKSVPKAMCNEPDEYWKKLLKPKLKRLIVIFYSALFSAIASVVFMYM